MCCAYDGPAYLFLHCSRHTTGMSHLKIRIKVLKCCATIYFNCQCLARGIVPKYADIKVPYTSPAYITTQKKMQITRSKDEIKHLYRKKDILNKSLYKMHLQAANEWGNNWHIIRDSIHNAFNQTFQKPFLQN